jgi:hypothetical protein
LSGQREAETVLARLSPRAKRLIAEAGLDALRGGPRSTELSNLTDFAERDSRGKVVRHTRIDPAKAEYTEELVRFGLAYVPAQADKDKFSYVVLTRLGEAAGVLAARSICGPRAASEAKRYSTLSRTSAHLGSALFFLEDGTRTDGFRYFGLKERRQLKEMIRETKSLRTRMDAFRDSFAPNSAGPTDARRSLGAKEGFRATRPGRP